MTKKNKTGKKNKKSNQKVKSDKVKSVVTFLNYVLLFLLVVLVSYEVIEFKRGKNAAGKHTEAVSADVEEKTAEQKDMEYLLEALYIDEMDGEQVPDFKTAINMTDDSMLEPVADVWEEKLAHINSIDMPSEDIYGLYEEKLPDNVIKISETVDMKTDTAPVIAIVIDDMGISHKRTADISSLKYPLTASFLTYGTKLNEQVGKSAASGHEIIAHIPMEPKVMKDVSPDVLTIKMTDKQIEDGLEGMLKKFSGIKGVNNHMGSRFTEDEKKMNVVMKILEKKNLFFLDSKTTAKSKVEKAAKRYGVDYASRNVFLDNEDSYKYIMKQLKITEDIAKKEGYAIAIGHPKAQTYNALKAWLPTLKNKNIRLVHLSEIVKEINHSK